MKYKDLDNTLSVNSQNWGKNWDPKRERNTLVASEIDPLPDPDLVSGVRSGLGKSISNRPIPFYPDCKMIELALSRTRMEVRYPAQTWGVSHDVLTNMGYTLTEISRAAQRRLDELKKLYEVRCGCER